MTTAAERIKAAKERDEARAEQEEPETAADEEAAEEAETPAEPEPEPTGPGVGPDSEPEDKSGKGATRPQEPVSQAASLVDVEGLEREAKRHEKALKRLLGEQSVQVLCDACEGWGYKQPWHLVAGTPPTSDRYIGCPDCEATGQLDTQSRRPGFELIDCGRCGGRGFLERIEGAGESGDQAAGTNGDAAEYGRPAWMGDPSIGAGGGFQNVAPTTTAPGLS